MSRNGVDAAQGLHCGDCTGPSEILKSRPNVDVFRPKRVGIAFADNASEEADESGLF
jgi:hypothetical protein